MVIARGPGAPHFNGELTKSKASGTNTAAAAATSEAPATLLKVASGRDPVADRLAWMNSDVLLDEMREIDWKARPLGYKIVRERPPSDRLELRIAVNRDDSDARIRENFEAALAAIKMRRHRLGGKPGQRATFPRTDERVERATFFLWLSTRASKFGKRLTKRAIAELWGDLTKEWSWCVRELEQWRTPGIDAMTHFRLYPQATFAFDEWRRTHQRDWPVTEMDIALEDADPEVDVTPDEIRRGLAAAARARDNLDMSPGPEETVETMDDERVKRILRRLRDR